ncbi:MAG: hypothetical protein RBG13Loki_1094 [Promethearchaeota archaeon CR_4]|nr:MAG: hypothetical protein RBG13Loki_1094 [Candidatus Lokiarchaeota archaeon CR_4]
MNFEMEGLMQGLKILVVICPLVGIYGIFVLLRFFYYTANVAESANTIESDSLTEYLRQSSSIILVMYYKLNCLSI